MKNKPEDIFRRHGGQLRMSGAIKYGITCNMLYSLRDKGIIEQVSRGIYRLVDLTPVSNPDVVTVALRYPNAVICLISVLCIPHGSSHASGGKSLQVCIPRQEPGNEAAKPHQRHRGIYNNTQCNTFFSASSAPQRDPFLFYRITLTPATETHYKRSGSITSSVYFFLSQSRRGRRGGMKIFYNKLLKLFVFLHVLQ
ncbi:MAG: type IV toxin-antitoxin system AbiEi family antitoxin domain-containing protein [Proteobacteria bacterium]|nr:type IV toxin-antitoxin system AbiEi family antitoxin domain-containing protein [Pseudomonadota bacterium]